jgi:uncharacterized cupin superfamily protein
MAAARYIRIPSPTRKEPEIVTRPEEAPLEEWPTGRIPTTDGWFVVNVRDAAWAEHPQLGAISLFENPRGQALPDFGIRVRVLQPGQPMSYYHAEQAQEGFLVLSGQCLLIVNDEERPLRAWDFFHCPAGTEHVLIGTGDAPVAILAVGARPDPESFRYPASPAALRHGAAVATETTDPDEAYAGLGDWDLGHPDGFDAMPWA